MVLLSDALDESSTCDCDIECVCIFECECEGIECECEDCAKEPVFDNEIESWEQ